MSETARLFCVRARAKKWLFGEFSHCRSQCGVLLCMCGKSQLFFWKNRLVNEDTLYYSGVVHIELKQSHHTCQKEILHVVKLDRFDSTSDCLALKFVRIRVSYIILETLAWLLCGGRQSHQSKHAMLEKWEQTGKPYGFSSKKLFCPSHFVQA